MSISMQSTVLVQVAGTIWKQRSSTVHARGCRLEEHGSEEKHITGPSSHNGGRTNRRSRAVCGRHS